MLIKKDVPNLILYKALSFTVWYPQGYEVIIEDEAIIYSLQLASDMKCIEIDYLFD